MTHTSEATLNLFRQRGRCAWCGAWRHRLDPHHLTAKGMGGGSQLDVHINLLPLCRLHHTEAHNGLILRCDLLALVAAREGCLQGDVEEVLWLLQRLPKGGTKRAAIGELEELPESARVVGLRTIEEVFG